MDAEEFFAFVNTAQERAACDRLFKQLDRSGDGLLSRKEIEKGLANLNTIPSGTIGMVIKVRTGNET